MRILGHIHTFNDEEIIDRSLRALLDQTYPVEEIVTEKNENLIANQDAMELRSTKLVWPPLLRKLDRIDPSYKT